MKINKALLTGIILAFMALIVAFHFLSEKNPVPYLIFFGLFSLVIAYVLNSRKTLKNKN